MTFNPKTRKWIYGITIAALPILAAIGVIDDSQVTLWVALAAAIFAPALAIRNVTPGIDETARDEDFGAEDFNG